MRLLNFILALGLAAPLVGCSREDSQRAGQALGNVSTAVGDVVSPTAANVAQGFVDTAITPHLEAMIECQRLHAPAQRITENVDIKGRPVKECLAENGGIINEAVIRCRNGYSTTQTREVPYTPNPAIRCP